jgi:hypothetical protein
MPARKKTRVNRVHQVRAMITVGELAKAGSALNTVAREGSMYLVALNYLRSTLIEHLRRYQARIERGHRNHHDLPLASEVKGEAVA